MWILFCLYVVCVGFFFFVCVCVCLGGRGGGWRKEMQDLKIKKLNTTKSQITEIRVHRIQLTCLLPMVFSSHILRKFQKKGESHFRQLSPSIHSGVCRQSVRITTTTTTTTMAAFTLYYILHSQVDSSTSQVFRACWVILVFHCPLNSDIDYRIFNLCIWSFPMYICEWVQL